MPGSPGEGHQSRGADGEGGHRTGGAPAPARSLDQAQGEGPDGHGQQDATGHVGDAGIDGRIPAVGDEFHRRHQGQHTDGDIHQKDQAPRARHQHPAQGGTDGGGDGSGGGPDAHGPCPPGGGRGGQQETEAGRCQSGGAGGLEDPEADERPQGRAGSAGGAGPGEHGQAEEEAGLAPVAVGQPAQGDEQGGVDDGVAVEDPAEIREGAAPEIVADGGEGNVDDEQIETGHEGGQRQDAQQPTGPGAAVP